jgi:hypothetical protein
MAHESLSSDSSFHRAVRTFSRPWPILLAGLGFTVAALALSETSLVPLRLLLLAAGLLMAGIAVSRRLQTASWELEDRAESAGLLALTAFVGVLAYLSMAPSWDSGRTFLFVFILVALMGSFLVLLPRTARRIAAVVLIVFHFGGILSAVLSVAPRDEQPPWLAMQLWTRVYRPYLWFAYLTNAYHFYSPDPGPPTLLWFHVEYEDGSARWIKIPNRHESPVSLHHFRMLAAAENTMTPGPTLTAEQIPVYEAKFKRKYELLPGIPHPPLEQFVRRRQLIGTTLPFTDPKDNNRPAPLQMVMMPSYNQLTPMNQFSEPQEMARRLIASYARHIARTSPDPNDPHNEVKAVRVYRVVHELISPRQLHEGELTPWDDTTFKPYYVGKYDRDGRLLDPDDPFLYWWVPIIRVPKNYGDPGTILSIQPPPPEASTKIIDFVEIHATQSDRFEKVK